MFRFSATILSALTLSLPLCAEVYSLFPKGASRRAGAGQAENFTVSGTKMMELPVTANGIALTLKISKLDLSWQELLQQAQAAQLEVGKDFIRFRRKLPDGRVQRQLFAASGSRTNASVTLFELMTPPKLPPAEWPKELPRLPGDVQPGLVLNFGKTHGVYAGFSMTQSAPENQLAAISAQLKMQGWQAAGAEGSPAIRGRGELFIRNTPQRELLWVTFFNNSGAVFCRPQRTN